MKEFFGIGGYTRTAEGFLSWQHLTQVFLFLSLMVVLAVIIGKRNIGGSREKQNKVLIWSAILIDGFELFKIGLLCYRSNAWSPILHNLPLFLCSIQLIALPLAAFSRGRLQEASLDFVCIFGILGAVCGTIGAGQNYNCYPVLSFDNVVSAITHSISGFASLYIMISRMASLKKANIPVTFGILATFCVAAYVTNILVDYNYMFLMAGDGTPYDILFNLVGGNPVFYPLCVVGLFLVYISIFYYVHFLLEKNKNKKSAAVSL